MLKKTRWIGAAALVASAAMILSACAGGGSSDEAGEAQTVTGADYNPQDRDALQQGGDVVWPLTDFPAQENPMQGDGAANGAKIWAWYNPTLVYMTPEGEAYKNDDYLDEWSNEVVDGKRVLTFTFTDDAIWNDGSPITWESIRTTWEALRGEGDYIPSSTDGYEKIESVEMGDTEKTAIVTFEDEYPWVEGLFWNILNPAVSDADTFNNAYVSQLHPEWGSGPYTVETADFDKGVITFVPNENWWGDEPLLDSMTFRQMDDVAAMNAFLNGEVDAVRTSSADRLAQVADMDDVTTYRSQRAANNLFEINAERPQLSDLDVREAMMMGIDREQITEVMWDGLNYTEEPAGSFNLYPFQDGYVDALSASGWKYDPDAANELLDGAGWTLNEDSGIREKDGEALSVRMPIFGDDPIVEARARVIQQQMKAIGVDLEIDARASADFATVLSTKDWDVVMLAFTSGDPYGVAYMNQIYGSDSSLNLSSTGTAEIDDKISEVAALPTEDEQTAAGMELESEIMSETWGILPLYAGPEIWTVKTGLANLSPEVYTGLDMFGVHPVEDFGWMAE
ncbi:ABC transporter family substrate-binding protein [Microbacterium indicum]|uniref:ABC transporter family substrate-binding protein n=1 Tax=Microbacterium indicum TaxID=358100 RepID=UPI0003F7597D|nr:ABC transporter family substrate-binding protein [Microbacterium indicum]